MHSSSWVDTYRDREPMVCYVIVSAAVVAAVYFRFSVRRRGCAASVVIVHFFLFAFLCHISLFTINPHSLSSHYYVTTSNQFPWQNRGNNSSHSDSNNITFKRNIIHPLDRHSALMYININTYIWYIYRYRFNWYWHCVWIHVCTAFRSVHTHFFLPLSWCRSVVSSIPLGSCSFHHYHYHHQHQQQHHPPPAPSPPTYSSEKLVAEKPSFLLRINVDFFHRRRRLLLLLFLL